MGARGVRPSGAAELGLTDKSDIAGTINEAIIRVDRKAPFESLILNYSPLF